MGRSTFFFLPFRLVVSRLSRCKISDVGGIDMCVCSEDRGRRDSSCLGPTNNTCPLWRHVAQWMPARICAPNTSRRVHYLVTKVPLPLSHVLLLTTYTRLRCLLSDAKVCHHPLSPEHLSILPLRPRSILPQSNKAHIRQRSAPEILGIFASTFLFRFLLPVIGATSGNTYRRNHKD